MAKETVILRQGPLDGQIREVETSKDHYTHDEVKHDLIMTHHYYRVKTEDQEPGKMAEFSLDNVEYRKLDQKP